MAEIDESLRTRVIDLLAYEHLRRGVALGMPPARARIVFPDSSPPELVVWLGDRESTCAVPFLTGDPFTADGGIFPALEALLEGLYDEVEREQCEVDCLWAD